MRKLLFLLTAALSTLPMHSLSSYSIRSGGAADWLYKSPLTPLMLGICTTGIAVKALEDTHMIDVKHDTLSLVTGVGTGATFAAALYPFTKEYPVITGSIFLSAALMAGGSYYLSRPTQRTNSTIMYTENFLSGAEATHIRKILDNYQEYKSPTKSENTNDPFDDFLLSTISGKNANSLLHLKHLYMQALTHFSKLQYAKRELEKIRKLKVATKIEQLINQVDQQKDSARAFMNEINYPIAIIKELK